MKRKLIGIVLILANIAFSLIFSDHLKYILQDIMTGGPSLFASLGTVSLLVGIWLLGGDTIVTPENKIYAEEQKEEAEQSVRTPLLSRVMYGSAEFDDDSE